MTETIYYLIGFIVGAFFGWGAAIFGLAWQTHRAYNRAIERYGRCWVCGAVGIARFRVFQPDDESSDGTVAMPPSIDISACAHHLDVVREHVRARASDV